MNRRQPLHNPSKFPPGRPTGVRTAGCLVGRRPSVHVIDDSNIIGDTVQQDIRLVRSRFLEGNRQQTNALAEGFCRNSHRRRFLRMRAVPQLSLWSRWSRSKARGVEFPGPGLQLSPLPTSPVTRSFIPPHPRQSIGWLSFLLSREKARNF